MYLDSVSTVTVGNGHAIPALSDVDSINFVHKSSQAAASKAEKETAWNAVQAVSSPRGKKANYAAAYFETMSDLIVLPAEIDRLFDADLSSFYKSLVTIYPGFDSLPDQAKISLFDMIYNLGAGHIVTEFPHFTKAVRARDWNTAAAECLRPQLSAARNAATKIHFSNCASSGSSTTTQNSSNSTLKQTPPPQQSANKPANPPQNFSAPPFHKPIPHPQRFVRSPLIKQGDRGADVCVVQNALNRILIGQRPLLKVDGVFGLHVAQAVKIVQHHAGILGDGMVGAQTRRALDLVLA